MLYRKKECGENCNEEDENWNGAGLQSFDQLLRFSAGVGEMSVSVRAWIGHLLGYVVNLNVAAICKIEYG